MRRSLLFVVSVSALAACMGVETGEEAATSSPTPNVTESPTATPTSTATPTPSPTATPSGTVQESEDNGTIGTADDLGGSGSKSYAGTCADDLDDDAFKFTAAAGSFTASVTWNDGAGFDVDLYLIDDQGFLIEADEAVPPNDSPAQIAFTLPSAGTYYLGVICFGPGTNVPYTGVASVP